jgi:hypothetical protein
MYLEIPVATAAVARGLDRRTPISDDISIYLCLEFFVRGGDRKSSLSAEKGEGGDATDHQHRQRTVKYRDRLVDSLDSLAWKGDDGLDDIFPESADGTVNGIIPRLVCLGFPVLVPVVLTGMGVLVDIPRMLVMLSPVMSHYIESLI